MPTLIGNYPGIETVPDRMSGVPVLAQTRVPMSLLLANLAAGMSLAEIVDDLDLDYSAVQTALQSVAAFVADQRLIPEADPALLAVARQSVREGTARTSQEVADELRQELSEQERQA